MKFRSKLLLCLIVPAAMSAVALSVSVWGLLQTQHEFDRYIARYQAASTSLTEMYAQGLQSEQALRNVALDPGNPMGYKNFDNAVAAYEKAYGAAAELTNGTRLEAGVRRLQPLHAVQAEVQRRVLDLIKNKSDTVTQVLNADETPAWRAVRAQLLKQIDDSQALSESMHDATREHASRITAVVTVLTLAGFLLAGALGWQLVRTVGRELGDDPAHARDALRRIADGDLSKFAGEGRFPEGSVLAALSAMRSNLVRLIGQVRSAAEGIASGSSEIAAGNVDLSARTEQQAASLQETAASMDELTSTVKQNADNAQQASALASDASDVAKAGSQAVGRVVATMSAISESSSKIAEITGIIEGIAFQTNILALNAAVEAARAGEQGRGFAVVAGEVRALAQRSSNAAKEINELIAASVQQIREGSSLAGEAGKTMLDVTQAVQRVTGIMDEIAGATTEQSRGIEQVNRAIVQMDSVTQQNAALVEQAAAASKSLEDQGRLLSETISFFRLEAAQR